MIHLSILLSTQASDELRKLIDLVTSSEVTINNIIYTLPPSHPLQVSPTSLITVVTRATLDQLLGFTTGHPINNVVKDIWSISVTYGIDATFALAEAILETGWGTSYDAKVRHNWYGYEAYFASPSQAKVFANDALGIRTALTDIKQQYCTEGGTYYDAGQGATIAGWAKHWVNGGNSYLSAVSTIVTLMNGMIRHKP